MLEAKKEISSSQSDIPPCSDVLHWMFDMEQPWKGLRYLPVFFLAVPMDGLVAYANHVGLQVSSKLLFAERVSMRHVTNSNST